MNVWYVAVMVSVMSCVTQEVAREQLLHYFGVHCYFFSAYDNKRLAWTPACFLKCFTGKDSVMNSAGSSLRENSPSLALICKKSALLLKIQV